MSLNPWLELERVDDEFVLPMDNEAVATHNVRSKPQHRFELSMVPEPYMGAPDAPVVLLTGNPRFRSDDLPTHGRHDVQKRLIACVRQEEMDFPLVWLDPSLADTSGARWYRQRFRALIDAVGLTTLARGLAIYESLPYHSMELKQPKVPVPSQAYTNELARTAVQSGRLVLWQRAPWSRMLGIDLLQKPNVVRPNSLQSSYLSPGNLTKDVFEQAVALIAAHDGS